MDYALCATYGHLPMKPLCFPSILRATRLDCDSTHLLYSGFTHVLATKTLSPVIRAVDKSASPSPDDKRGGKILRGAIGASVVLACAIGVFSCSSNLRPKAIACPGDTMPSEYPTQVHITQVLGAKSAINLILEVSKNLITSNEKPSKNYKLPDKPSTADIRNLKTEAVRIIKSGNTSKAMDLLDKAYNSCKTKGFVEQANEADMAMAEILISQGKYEEALKRDCLKSEVPVSKSDTRFFLYKAIVHAILDNNDEAVKWWKIYIDNVGNGFDPNRPPSV